MGNVKSVSPGFTPRPSLSEAHRQPDLGRHRVSPGFTPRPSLSGVGRLARPPGGGVSPGFTPRPSLSGGRVSTHDAHDDVSPGFTPRPSFSVRRSAGRLHVVRVSPGFTPRPSLSGPSMPVSAAPDARRVSPGFTPRPSLSAGQQSARPRMPGGVAGVHAPAFVERTACSTSRPRGRSVAGVHAPAFVERGSSSRRSNTACRVSPGFTPRPSLSVTDPHLQARRRRCRRGSRPGLR